MSEGESKTSPEDKKIKKTFAKPLDKHHKVWYNNSTEEGNTNLSEINKIF
jgi:hypothetical protein